MHPSLPATTPVPRPRGRTAAARGAATALALLLAAACSGRGAAGGAVTTVRVFAAASLNAPFERLAREFESAHAGVAVELHFAGTSQLLMQIDEGARADVFASADVPNMDRLVARGHAAAAPVSFAQNRLAIVVAKGNPEGVHSLADLARAEVRTLLCAPAVPAGAYARQALAKARVEVRSLSDEPNVKAVVAKVQLGEADAGIVYATDARAAAAHVDAVPLAPEHDVVGVYPIVVLQSARAATVAAAFVEHVVSPSGQRTLQEFGFLPR